MPAPNQEPQWRSSYQGERHYDVGAYVSGQGTASVTCRYLLDYYQLETLNYPETFWGTLLGLVGTVRWGYLPHVLDCLQRFPNTEVAVHFPDYVPARYTADYKAVEYNGEPPVLIANSRGFTSLTEVTSHNAEYPVLADTEAPWWTGVASVMTKDLWFELIFPRLVPLTRANIIEFLTRKQVALPTLPELPDEPYVYYEGHQRWVIRRSPLLLPTLYFNQETGWSERSSQATHYCLEPLAAKVLGALRVKYSKEKEPKV